MRFKKFEVKVYGVGHRLLTISKTNNWELDLRSLHKLYYIDYADIVEVETGEVIEKVYIEETPPNIQPGHNSLEVYIKPVHKDWDVRRIGKAKVE